MALMPDRSAIRADLVRLGLSEGRDVLVQASLRQLGRVQGGAAAVTAAIRDVIGPAATLVVPTQTAGNSTTSRAYRHATKGMDATERAAYEQQIAGFDRDTPSQDMGALAEFVRRHPLAVRSGHPQTSFAAVGPRAEELMVIHDLECHLGERSPMAALYEADAQVLLLGVGYDVCIAFHLGEYRLSHPVARRAYTCFVMREGRRERVEFQAEDIYDDDFAELGADLAREGRVRTGRVGTAEAAVFTMKAAVDFAIGWMDKHREPTRRWRTDEDPFSLA